MASSLYDKGRQAFLEAGIAWLTGNIKAVLINTSLYTPSISTHQYLSDIPSGARVATSPNLSAKTSVAGVAGAANAVFASVTGSAASALALYLDTGTAGTSSLICYIDSATGLPFTPNGGDATVAWDTGVNKIFKL